MKTSNGGLKNVKHGLTFVRILFYDLPPLCIIGIVGGRLEGNRGRPFRGILTDVLDYDPDADKWTKVGQMATARSAHTMSLVPGETADFCV